MEKQESISQSYLNRLSVYMPYDDLIQKSTNTDVDPRLVHLQGVKGIQPMQHGYGYVYRYRADTDTWIRHFQKKPDTWIRFSIFNK